MEEASAETTVPRRAPRAARSKGWICKRSGVSSEMTPRAPRRSSAAHFTALSVYTALASVGNGSPGAPCSQTATLPATSTPAVSS